MGAVGDVSFELERFEWTGDDTLEVVGRWNGVRGRRMSRPTLTVEAGGRRHRLSGTADVEADPWRAVFDWDGSRGDIASAELELGRSLVVELPPPRRRRRRRGATTELDLRTQRDELRTVVAELTAERDRDEATIAELTAERDRLAHELKAARADDDEDERTNLREALTAAAAARADAEAARADAVRIGAELEALRVKQPATEELEALRNEASEAREDAERLRDSLRATETSSEDAQQVIDELAGLRLAHGSLKAAHERLEDELEELRANRSELGEVIRELQERTTAAEETRERLTAELAVAREDVTRLQGLLAVHEEALTDAETDAERRVETERAAITEVHGRLATAREEAQRSIVAEAEETERLRAELERTREDAERLLAAERAEVARLREELLNSEVDPAADEASRRMVERVTRDLDRERATSRTLRRELEALRSSSAEQRRTSALTGIGNGTHGPEDDLEPATPAGQRAVRTPLGTQRRVDAARVNAETRIPRVPPSRISLWIARLLFALVVAALAVGLVIIYQAVT